MSPIGGMILKLPGIAVFALMTLKAVNLLGNPLAAVRLLLIMAYQTCRSIGDGLLLMDYWPDLGMTRRFLYMTTGTKSIAAGELGRLVVYFTHVYCPVFGIGMTHVAHTNILLGH